LPVSRPGGAGADRVVSVALRDRLGAGGAAEHGGLADDPPPARGGRRGAAGPLRRQAVAREHGRGLPDRARDRAGPDRARGIASVVGLATGLPPRPIRLLRDPRTVFPRLLEQPFPVLRRDAVPELPEGDGGAPHAGAATEQARRPGHEGILASRSWFVPRRPTLAVQGSATEAPGGG